LSFNLKTTGSGRWFFCGTVASVRPRDTMWSPSAGGGFHLRSAGAEL